MEIKFFTDTDNPNSFLSNFLSSFNKFKFVFSKFNNNQIKKNQLSFFIITNNNFEKFKKTKIKFLKFENNNLVLFLPMSLKDYFKEGNFNEIYYPINIKDFEQKLLDIIGHNDHQYGPLVLNNKNLLLNKENNTKIYLTESETSILKYFFIKNIVSKAELRAKVLYLRENIDSKSLETHLSRLRKKILFVAKDIKIVSSGHKSLKIITLPQ